MISIIISTYQPVYLKAIKDNISYSIGVPYEIIAIENKGAMGICKAYNIGASKAKYPYLCFMHEDIEFITKNWGTDLINLFTNNNDIGLAGFAGSKYKSKFVTGWATGSNDFDRTHLYQKIANGSIIDITNNPNSEYYAEVVTLDGVCLFTTKNHWLQNKFNEDLLGFHFYDLDFSLKTIEQNKKVVVIYFIDIIHFSLGKFNDVWLNEAFKFHNNQKTQNIIKSIDVSGINKEILKQIKFYWFYRFKSEDISFFNKLKLFIGNFKLLNKENFEYTISLYLKQIKHDLSTKYLNK